ncbi:MAG: beta strand repeat-containing protein, partial [bacterium]
GPLATNGSAPSNYTSSTNPFKTAAVPVNLVKSGGFETPANTTAAPGNYQYNPSGSDWSFIGNSGLSGNGSGFTSTNPNAPLGKQVAFVQMTGSISQTVSGLVAGTKYNLTFVAAQRNGYFSSSQYQTLNITLGGQTVASNVKPDSVYYNQYSYSFTCNTSGSQVLTFTGLKPTNQDETVFLDAVVLSANLPDSSSSQGQVVNLTSPITNYTQQISALMTQSETATTFFSSNYEAAWNFGPSTQWTWMYPTEILMTIKNQLPACNPIAIDFSGVQYGSLGINSGSSLTLADNILFPGSVSLNSGDSIFQLSGAVIAANNLTGLSATGAIGNATSPLNLSISSGTINAQATTGLYLTSVQNLTIGQVSAANGPVQIQSGGSIFACSTSTNVSGKEIRLLASNGSIGSQAQPIAIQTITTTLPTGSVTGGLFTATANSAVFVTQATGDLRIASVTTTSPVGVVSINALTGNITDGNIPDAFGLNNGSFSPALVGQVINSMQLNSLNNVNTTIAAFEGSVDSSYLQYWTALQNGSVANGSLTLTANGVQYYQTNANLYYANTANQTSNATVAQVNSYANMLYDNAVNVFENNLAYGPGWASLPEFQVYNANYTFTPSSATISALSYRALNIGNDFALISLDALSPQGSALLGNATAPAIQTTVLDLKAGGSIGLTLDPQEIDFDSIQTGNLTASEKAALALASTAGELQIVGTSNATGQKVYYTYGSQPANVTETGVVVRINKALFVNVADNGLAMLQANGSINLSETRGSLNVLGATSSKEIRLTSQGDITQGQLQASTTMPGWSLNASGTLGYSGNGWTWTPSGLTLSANALSNVTTDGILRLVSGGDIGTPANPLQIQVNNALSVYASGSLALNQPTGDLLLSDVKAGPQGTVQINAGGNISNTKNVFKGSFSGFGGNGTGWTTNSRANGSVSISNNVLTLGQALPTAGGISSSSAMYGTPVMIDNSFISSFVYQSQTAGSNTYFLIKTAEESAIVANLTGVTPGSQITVGLQISTPSASALQQTVGLLYNGVLQDVQMPGGINFASGNAIQVVVTYNNSQKAITVALTDTVTLQTYSFVSNNIDMLKVLGSTKGQIGFFAMGNGQSTSQTISGFSFAYGSPSIQGQSVSLTSGGAIGTATNPILTQVSGNISATAPVGVYLLETSGNMYVQSVASTGNVSLAAPAGSVVGTSGGPVQASVGIRAAARPRAMGIMADQLNIQSLVA